MYWTLPFFVIATQNPIEHDGTWELPQAQLDRFLLHVVVDYPEMQAERDILDLAMAEAASDEGLEEPQAPPKPIAKAVLSAARRAALDVYVSPLIRDYIVRLIAGTRNDPKPLAGVASTCRIPSAARLHRLGAHGAGARLAPRPRLRLAR